MTTYTVLVKEIVTHTITVKADTEEQAKESAFAIYLDGNDRFAGLPEYEEMIVKETTR